MHSTEPFLFDELLELTRENSAMHMSQGFTVLQLYLKSLCLFSYDANEKRLAWKAKNWGQLKSACKM